MGGLKQFFGDFNTLANTGKRQPLFLTKKKCIESKYEESKMKYVGSYSKSKFTEYFYCSALHGTLNAGFLFQAFLGFVINIGLRIWDMRTSFITAGDPHMLTRSPRAMVVLFH